MGHGSWVMDVEEEGREEKRREEKALINDNEKINEHGGNCPRMGAMCGPQNTIETLFVNLREEGRCTLENKI